MTKEDRHESFQRDGSIPKKYKRRTGELRGKKVKLICKNCIWLGTSMPGEEHACKEVYVLDPELGPITEDVSKWYACEYHTHKEAMKVIKTLQSSPLANLRAMKALTGPIAELTDLVPKETLLQVFSSLLEMRGWQRTIVADWAQEFGKLLEGKAVYNGRPVTQFSEWIVKDTATGREYGAMVLRSDKKWVSLRIDKQDRDRVGTDTKKIAPDLFVKLARPADDDDEQLEDDE